MAKENKVEESKIDRKDALKKIGSYGKYAALTALGTYMILSPQSAQAQSPETPGAGFGGNNGDEPGSGF